MYILQHSPPPRQCTDSLSFPIIFEPIRQFVGYKKPQRAGALRGGASNIIGYFCFYFIRFISFVMAMAT